LFGSGNPSLRDPEIAQPSIASDTLLPRDETFVKPKKLDKYGIIGDKNKHDDTVAPTSPDRIHSTEALAAKPHIPRDNPCLWLFHLLSGLTVIVSLCLLATQILPLFFSQEAANNHDVLSLALRAYISLFCILFAVNETEALPCCGWIRSNALLERFFSRGFLYSFMGLIAVQESDSERIASIVTSQDNHQMFHVQWVAIFMQLSSWFMLAIGVVYMLMGVCCMKRLRDGMKLNEKEAWKQYRKDLRAWKERYAYI
jgi:hypothetical protein